MSPGDIQALIRAALRPVRNLVLMTVGRAVIAAVNATNQTQLLQLNLLADETSGQLEQFQEYGFASVPFAGAEAAVMFVMGDRSHGIVVATQDRRYRLATMQGGEVALYDDQGQYVWLKREGIDLRTPFNLTGEVEGDLTLTVSGSATISAQSAVVEAESLDLGSTGGQGVARVGDTVANGVITSGSSKVRAA